MEGVGGEEGSGRMTREWERKSTKILKLKNRRALFISAGVNTACRAAAALTED